MLRKLAPLLSVAMLLATHAEAASLVCTSLGDFSWSAIDDSVASNWDCTDADSPGADDTFVIDHAVTLTGDILQDGVTSGTGIIVRSGGSLIAPGPLTIAINEDGIECQAGSTCSLTGAYREFGSTTPGTLLDPDPAHSFVVGDVIPCPDANGVSDCSDPGLRGTVRLSYPDAIYGPGGPRELANACASVAGVDPGTGVGDGDVIAFWNPDPSDPNEGTDTNYWYEVSEVVGGASCHIDFSVHQGENDQSGYPLARREVAGYTPAVAIARGSRAVELGAGTLPANDYHNGRMLRLERAGAPSAETYRIYDTVTAATDECADAIGPCDLIKIADHLGFATPVDTGLPDADQIWIDYGWQTDDPFMVVSPVRIRAASPARQTATVKLSGSVRLQAVVLYRTSTLVMAAEDVLDCRDLWLEDLFSGPSDKLNIKSALECERVSITGGDPEPAQDISHTVVVETSDPITLRALGLRHGGDDFFSVHTGDSPTVVFDRFRGQFKSSNAPSDECIATGGSPVFLTATDVECIDATNTGGVFGPGTRPTDVFDIDSVMVIAARGTFWASVFNNAEPNFRDVTIIGSELIVANAELLPGHTERFVVRDSSAYNGARLLRAGQGYSRDGLMADNTVIDSLVMVPKDIDISNVAIVRTQGLTNATLVSSVSTPASSSWRNVLFYQAPGDPVFSRLWHFRSTLTDLSGYTMGGVAFVNGNRGIQNGSGISFDDPTLGMQFDGPLCFFGNTIDAGAGTLAQIPASSLIGVPPEFVSPDENRFDPAPGSPWDLAQCGVLRGAQAPGVRAFRRVHAWSNLMPEFMGGACSDGVDNDGDGEVDFPDDDDCESSEDDTELGGACSDDTDNDGDLLIDFPDDPGCRDAAWPFEDPKCQDGIDNDGDGFIDWDGGGQGPADPQCGGQAFSNRERKLTRCGLGGEAGLALAALIWARTRRRR